MQVARGEEPADELEPWGPGDVSGEDDAQLDDDEDQKQLPGGGPYATLHLEGPQVCLGSAEHPEGCTPCTFYCFTRRGCNRGLDCRFCHLTHQSKLQQRREAWKKQQREKRKSIRERVAAEALARRHTPGGKGNGPISDVSGQLSPAEVGAALTASGMGVQHQTAQVVKNIPVYNKPNKVERPNDLPVARASDSPGNQGPAVFVYTPGRAILTIGQEAEFRPQIAARPTQFRLTAQLPQGLVLDPVSGVICGAPAAPLPQMTVVVEADLLGGRIVRAALELEVVDFTRGGFVVGHMSEFEPGKFMLILYVPQESENNGGEKGYPLMLEGGGCSGGIDGNPSTNGQLAMRKNGASMEQEVFYPGDIALAPPLRGGVPPPACGGDRQALAGPDSRHLPGRGARGGAGMPRAPGQPPVQSPDWW